MASDPRRARRLVASCHFLLRVCDDPGHRLRCPRGGSRKPPGRSRGLDLHLPRHLGAGVLLGNRADPGVRARPQLAAGRWPGRCTGRHPRPGHLPRPTDRHPHIHAHRPRLAHDAIEHDRDPAQQLCPQRPRQGAARARRDPPPRPAQRAPAHHHRARDRCRLAHRRHRRRRDGVLVSRARTADDVRHRAPRPPADPGQHPRHRGDILPLQPRRRPPLRLLQSRRSAMALPLVDASAPAAPAIGGRVPSRVPPSSGSERP